MNTRSKGPSWRAVTTFPMVKPVVMAEDFSRLLFGPRKYRPARITRRTIIPIVLS